MSVGDDREEAKPPPPQNALFAPAILRRLECPVCQDTFEPASASLRCRRGHVFDIARQGYVNLLRTLPPSADTAGMIAARAAFLDAGHYEPLSNHLAQIAKTFLSNQMLWEDAEDGPCILEIGAGTGHHLSQAVESTGGWGIALDSSKYAARRAAKAHPRIASLVGDARARLPIRDGSIDLLLCVFAPRNGEEFHRVLAKDGLLIVVTPEAAHMQELVEPLGLLRVDPQKEDRLLASLGDRFVEISSESLEWTMKLTREEVVAAVLMGPSAHHVEEGEVRRRVGEMGDVVEVTVEVRGRVFQGQ